MQEFIESPSQDRSRGQALIEYALILALIAVAFGVALAATGPVIGNVFRNTVFNVVGAPPNPGEIGGPEEFWLTVTYVAANPPAENALPTRTPPPATNSPTPGPSPTPSPVTPTNTRQPSPTPTPSPTPLDVSSVAPFKDEANPYPNTVADPERWRVNSGFFLGTDDWCGDYFANTSLTGEVVQQCNRLMPNAPRGLLDFNWGERGPFNFWPGGPEQAANNYQNFSVRYTKPIWIDPSPTTGTGLTPGTNIPIAFNLTYDDGVRFYIVRPGCTGAQQSTGAPAGAPAAPVVRQEPDANCLVVDDWNPGGGSVTVVRNIPVGTLNQQQIRLVVEYFEGTGPANISLTYGRAPNPDDTRIAGGNPTAGTPDCNWGRRQNVGDIRDSLQSETSQWMWEEYRGGDPATGGFPLNMRCHLEYRGYVQVPAGNWEFTYWDVWDLQGAGNNTQSAWLEIAEYRDNPALSVDRTALQWQRVNLRASAGANYNWTRNVVSLNNVNGVDFTNKRVTFRFVMQNQNGNNVRRWYIDDIEIKQSVPARTFTIGSGTGSPNANTYVYAPGQPNSFWDFNTNNAEQAQDFITSVGWRLTGVNVAGTPGGTNQSWEQSPGTNYTRFSESPAYPLAPPYNTAPFTAADTVRTHYIEFNGLIDVSGTTPDREGDSGQAMLSFYHAYNIGRYTGLEVQYSTTPYGVGPAVWQAVPDPDPLAPVPAGRIVATDNTLAFNRPAMEKKEINLSGIPVPRFRLRFALLVRSDAVLSDGWFIDNIYLERIGRPLFLDYPFFDGAEVGIGNWLVSGNWARTADSFWPDALDPDQQHSFTDSPGTNPDGTPATYQNNANSLMRTAWAIDFNNDTPENLLLTNRNPAGGNTRTTAAVNPVMTFWHRRILNSNENFFVEWRKAGENDTQWKPLWAYTFQMTTTRAVSDGRFSRNVAWEFVYIDLRPITRTFTDPVSRVDDDVVFRFRLNSANDNTLDDGIYIDHININEFSEVSYRLWNQGENRDIGGGTLLPGSGSIYTEDLDGPDTGRGANWMLNGTWNVVNWEQSNGIFGLHDSVAGIPSGRQIAAPTTPIVNEPNRTYTYPLAIPPVEQLAVTPHDSFSVLELLPTFDLRATRVEDEPTLYFWTRYDIGQSDRIVVQISSELQQTDAQIITQMNNWCRSTQLEQCYEHYRGWSEWTNTPFNIASGSSSTSRTNNWAWTRQQVDLSSFAAAGATPGRRIRIRFVMDALDGATNRDGWYIDQVSIQPRRDGPLVGQAPINSRGFFDNARNLNNWIPEGSWGLDPEVYYGSGGAPTALGVWREFFWNGPNPFGATQADTFLDGRRGATTSDATRTVVDINYDIRRNSPRPGIINTDRFAGRWVLDTPVIGSPGTIAGDYSYITVSDDGVRMKYEEIDGAGNVIDANPRTAAIEAPITNNDLQEWNMIYNWTDHSRAIDMSSVPLVNGKRYRFTLEWYDGGSDAVLILTVGGSNFSFTDSPKQGAGPAFPDIPAIPRANSSLMLDGTLDLRDTTNPVISYRNYYEVEGQARFEVSTDGGFTWRTDGFTDALGFDTGFQGAGFNGTNAPQNTANPSTAWQERRHNLTRYAGQQIMIRFRLDHSGTDCLSRDGNGCALPPPNGNNTNWNPNQWFVSWWIADIQLFDVN
ncbi:MAG: hypothetical protein SF029_13855 [bacterium]|nr:hypothetical protein [bacterium]